MCKQGFLLFFRSSFCIVLFCFLTPSTCLHTRTACIHAQTQTQPEIVGFVQDLHPPKELFIMVRVLQGVGEIMTENGTIMLEKDSQHFLRRSDVEPLIRQGILEHIP